MSWSQLGWIDLALLGLLGLSGLVGLWRGLTFELVSMLGWVVAWVLANAAGPQAGQWLPVGEPGTPLRQGLGYAAVFLAVLLICAVLARLLRALISATPLSVIDRLLGGVFGLVRAGVVMLVIATVVAMTPFSHSTSWQASHGALWLGQALQGLKPVLPDTLHRQLQA